MTTTSDVGAPVVAIDGPSGAGKGTVCQQLVTRLGWHLLDSGALYRLTGLYARQSGVDLDDVDGLAALAARLPADFSVADGREVIWLDGVEVTAAIRTEQAGGDASRVAALQPVRDALLERQREFRQPPGLIADGRDMGTVVFPDAPLKIFLTASAEERAVRRHKQLKEQGVDVSLAELSAEIAERDERDRSRTNAPLKPASDARILDTTSMDVDAVVHQALQWIAERYSVPVSG